MGPRPLGARRLQDIWKLELREKAGKVDASKDSKKKTEERRRKKERRRRTRAILWGKEEPQTAEEKKAEVRVLGAILS